MPFGLCNAPATFERLMDRVLCGMRWSRCLVYLDDVISFGGTVTEALGRLEEVLCRLSNFGLQLKAKKCTFMQTEVVFVGHIVGRTGLACDPTKLAAVRNCHAPDKVKGVVGFVGYYRRFVKDFADLAEPLVALTRKGAPFVWTDRQQTEFETLKACLMRAPILGYPTGRVDGCRLPELSCETWVTSALIEEFTADLFFVGSNVDLIAASRQDATLAAVREWIQS